MGQHWPCEALARFSLTVAYVFVNGAGMHALSLLES